MLERYYEPSQNLRNIYDKFYSGTIEKTLEKEVNESLENIINTNAAYEGVVLPSKKTPLYSFDWGKSKKFIENIKNGTSINNGGL